MDETKEYRVTIPTDEEGMHGKECPNPDCGKYFKIKPGTGIAANPVVFCPYCKHQGTPQDFITKDQIEYAKSIAVRDIVGQFAKELKQLETRSPSRNSLFSIEIKVESQPYPIRHYMEKRLQENVKCAECTCEYAIFGMFAVCPDCGKHNLFQMFMKNLDVVRRQVQLEDELHKKFDEADRSHVDALMKDIGDKLVENACEDAVSTFETFCKQAYEQAKSRAAAPSLVLQGNPFQSLDRAKDIFASQFGLDILAGMAPAEIDGVYLLFNKRHILTHNLGIIDQKFLKSTGLRQDILDHKVEVTKQEVLSALSTIQKMGESIKAALLR